MSKSKEAVSGPKLPLPLKAKRVKPGVRAKGTEPQRTMRMRFVEPPTKKDGNPFFALRVPAGLLRAFKACARKKNTEATAMVREYMSKVTGVSLETEGAE